MQQSSFAAYFVLFPLLLILVPISLSCSPLDLLKSIPTKAGNTMSFPSRISFQKQKSSGKINCRSRYRFYFQ